MCERPPGGGLGITDDAEIGEGPEFGDELLPRQGVEWGLGQIGHGPEADGAVLGCRGDQWVFVIPKMLRPYFLHHRELLGGLARAAWETVLELMCAAAADQSRTDGLGRGRGGALPVQAGARECGIGRARS